MSATYLDTMKCPKGHKRAIVRRVSTAKAAIVAGRRIYSYCCDCRKSYYVTPSEPPIFPPKCTHPNERSD